MTPMNSSESWGDRMRLVSYCPVCETRYHPMQARMLGRSGETHLLHVQCRKCHHAILALVLVNHAGASSVGLLTDLTYEDVLSFRSNTSISVNDVIDLHALFARESWQDSFGKIKRKRVQPVKNKQKKL